MFMDTKERDSIIQLKILNEIADIEAFVSGMTLETLSESKIVQKAIIMSLINIGELSKAFSEAYIDATKEIPWKAIRGMRNIAAHHYEAIRIPNVWLTVQEDVPALKQILLRQHGV